MYKSIPRYTSRVDECSFRRYTRFTHTGLGAATPGYVVRIGEQAVAGGAPCLRKALSSTVFPV